MEANIGLQDDVELALEASHKAMEEVTGAAIAIAFGLSAVFVPTAFISGISGQFFKQFALTIAVSTLLSAFISLTLTPALCAILLQPHGAKKDWFGRAWDWAFGWFFQHEQHQLARRVLKEPASLPAARSALKDHAKNAAKSYFAGEDITAPFVTTDGKNLIKRSLLKMDPYIDDFDQVVEEGVDEEIAVIRAARRV